MLLNGCEPGRGTRRLSRILQDLVVDSFAGGGGVSSAIECAPGRGPDIAINHDPDAIDRYFKLRTKLELTEAAAEDKQLLAGLLQALGPDRFAQAFKLKQCVEVAEAFHADFTLKPEVEATARPFVDNEAAKAYKPSLRQ